jgi:hypothetical protein
MSPVAGMYGDGAQNRMMSAVTSLRRAPMGSMQACGLGVNLNERLTAQ